MLTRRLHSESYTNVSLPKSRDLVQEELLTLFLLSPSLQLSSVRVVAGEMVQRPVKAIVSATGVKSCVSVSTRTAMQRATA
jgi:hypothetical protein